MKFKRITAMFMTFLLVLPSFLVSAEKGESSSEEKKPQGEGTYAEKHEVVYATLSATGNQEEMYVVNNFKIEDQGTIIDHGAYTKVENLTDLEEIKQENSKVKFTAASDQFYYQGNLKDKPLPWDIGISYSLDGKRVASDDLPGKDGELEIQIDTAKKEGAPEAFFNNYLLQITLKLDSKIYENIEAPGGSVANAGKNRQVTFTVMPEKEESFTVNADVTDMEMNGIEIAAIPSSMSFDAPDADTMTGDMKSLSDATAEINKGVGELKNGIAELNNGAAELQNGSAQYKNGINELNNGSSELVNGSASIKSSLQQMSESVNGGSSDMNLGELKQMVEGLRQLAGGLKETETGLTDLKNQYSQANQALAQAIESIPASEISDADIQALKESGANQEVVNKLVASHQAAQGAKATYNQVSGAFQAVTPALEQSAAALGEMRANVNTMADGLSSSLENMNVDDSMKQLQEGLQQLSSNYSNFHAGLTEYTGGVSELAGSYNELHGGIAGLANGTAELENGAAELHEGTSELADSTSDLPGQMQGEIDQMISEYDKSGFEPVSFVSSENKKVTSVQFVIKTEAIKKEEKAQEEPEQEEEKGFWDRLLALFN
ncbi:YhgE/Pip domain-containing protein [Thalassobacillus hwangdonensis]|uniref:YhgE/Pip domain-containing protein n=1 Tax=Thalassobacillus hwangdonensis TaxID=546108 RepID=A0ABW3L8X0_9BACI